MSLRLPLDTKRKRWTPERLRLLRNLYPHKPTSEVAATLGTTIPKVYNKAWLLGLKKTAAYLASPAACRLRRGDAVGAAFRFKKGFTPWNAGMKGWQAPGRSKQTRFKKGNYSSRWDREIYCIGALRISRDGRLEIKVKEGLRAWEGLARFVWMTERGQIPKGAMVRSKNGDPDDTRLSNLRLTKNRAELMRENTYHRYPKEIARLIQLRGALQRQINKREGKHERKHDQRPA